MNYEEKKNRLLQLEKIVIEHQEFIDACFAEAIKIIGEPEPAGWTCDFLLNHCQSVDTVLEKFSKTSLK